jgi:hypothetical protein
MILIRILEGQKHVEPDPDPEQDPDPDPYLWLV